MDSLLANYGASDDEEDSEVYHGAFTPAALYDKPAPSTRCSLFSRLPPPSQVTSEFGGSSAGERSQQGIAGALPPPKNLTANIWEDGSVDHEVQPKGQPFERNGQRAGALGGRLSALLPPPRNTAGSGVSGPQKKRTVEFKPPVNIALLEKDVEDERPEKRSSNSYAAVGASSKLGLAAILPPPKHSLGLGAVLGSGAGPGGRRTIMETQSRLYTDHASPAVTSSEATLEQSSGYDTVDYPQLEEYQCNGPPMMRQQSQEQGSFQGQEEARAYQEGNYPTDQSWQYQDSHIVSGYEQAPSATVADDPLARVLQSERKRGRAQVSPNIIEVKQSDLTAGKLREDKLKPTGIAFGPSYQPMASNKNKPSKIHRRKHQIGSLYFDMKQREMELLERRSRGQMTKAETQAKYGW